MAKAALGTKVWLGDNDDDLTTADELLEISSFDPPERSRETVDVTALDDTFRERLGNIRDSGEATVEMFFTSGSATDALCNAAYVSTAPLCKLGWSVKTAAGIAYYKVSGLVTNYDTNALAPDGAQVASLTFEPSGAITTMTEPAAP